MIYSDEGHPVFVNIGDLVRVHEPIPFCDSPNENSLGIVIKKIHDGCYTILYPCGTEAWAMEGDIEVVVSGSL